MIPNNLFYSLILLLKLSSTVICCKLTKNGTKMTCENDVPLSGGAVDRSKIVELMLINVMNIDESTFVGFDNLTTLELDRCVIPALFFSKMLETNTAVDTVRIVEIQEGVVLKWQDFKGITRSLDNLHLSSVSCQCENLWLLHKDIVKFVPKKLVTIIDDTIDDKWAPYWKVYKLPQNVTISDMDCRNVPICDNANIPELTITYNRNTPIIDCKSSMKVELERQTINHWKTISDLNYQKQDEKHIRTELQMLRGQHRFSAAQNGWVVCRHDVKSKAVLPTASLGQLRIRTVPNISDAYTDFTNPTEKYCRFMIDAHPAPIDTWRFKSIFQQKTVALNDSNDQEVHFHRQTLEPPHNHKYYVVAEIPANTHNQGNYTLRVCNGVGCDERICEAIWDKESLESATATYNPKNMFKEEFEEAGRLRFLLVGIIIVCLLLIFCILTSGVCVCYRRRVYLRQTWKHRGNASDLMSDQQPLNSVITAENSIYLATFGDHRPISPEGWRNLDSFLGTLRAASVSDLTFLGEIGEGAFGTVFLVEYNGESKHRRSTVSSDLSTETNAGDGERLAAKRLWIHTENQALNLRNEAGNLAKLTHPNIVTFHGLCPAKPDEDSVYLLFEYMSMGDLKTFLQERHPIRRQGMTEEQIANYMPNAFDPLDVKTQIEICLFVAQGLSYLAENHFVHRDLAARNCLVSCEPNSRLQVKISDFGMSRDIYLEGYYKVDGNRMLPVRWMAPEVFHCGRYTDASDVWSMAVLFWEVFSFGQLPWTSYSNHEVMECVKAGQLLGRPDACPADIYDAIMTTCWTLLVDQRPSAKSIAHKLSNQLRQAIEQQ